MRFKAIIVCHSFECQRTLCPLIVLIFTYIFTLLVHGKLVVLFACFPPFTRNVILFEWNFKGDNCFQFSSTLDNVMCALIVLRIKLFLHVLSYTRYTRNLLLLKCLILNL